MGKRSFLSPRGREETSVCVKRPLSRLDTGEMNAGKCLWLPPRRGKGRYVCVKSPLPVTVRQGRVCGKAFVSYPTEEGGDECVRNAPFPWFYTTEGGMNVGKRSWLLPRRGEGKYGCV